MVNDNNGLSWSSLDSVKNNYESLYYNVPADDLLTDACLKVALQDSFSKYNVARNDDGVDEGVYRTIMIDALVQTVEDIDGQIISPDQVSVLTYDFDRFVKYCEDPYDTFFDNFEDQNDGESVDILTKYNRNISNESPFRIRDLYYEDDVIDELDMAEEIILGLREDYYMDLADVGPEHTNESPDRMEDVYYVDDDVAHVEEDGMGRRRESFLEQADKISYSQKVTVPKITQRRSFAHVRQEEAAADELKLAGGNFDKKHDEIERARGDSYKKFTSGDSYGFDERDDDGPDF